ncbi:MAG: hypothetical protein R3F56_12205 [Planctomycetota bacterium]
MRAWRTPWPVVVALLATAAVFAAVYGPALSLFFTADDFVLLQYSKDTSAVDIVRTRLLALPGGGGASPYWRPGWLLLLDTVYEVFGLTPAAFRAVVFALHAVLAAGVYLVARRWLVRSSGLAAGACALFALSPAGAEALLWIAAGANVMPAALCLFVAAAAYATHVERPRPARLGLAWLGYLLAFTFREAAYHMPLVVLVAHLCLESGPLLRRGARGALRAMPFGVVVLVHHHWFNPYSLGHLSPAENLNLFMAHGAAWLRVLFDLPVGTTAIAVCVAALLLALVVLPPRGRFCLLWACAASFPFVARSHETRFVYFVQAPLALALAALADRSTAGRRLPMALATTVLLGLAGANAKRVPAEVSQARARSATTRAVVDLITDQRLATRAVLHVDFVPPELLEGFADLIELYGGARPGVVDYWVLPRPPFLLYMNPAFADLDPDQEMLHWDAASGRYALSSKRDLVGGRPLIPTFGFRYRARVVRDWAEMQFSPDVVHLRQEPEPPLRLDAAGHNAIVTYAGGTLDRIELTVDAQRDAYLVVAFPADLTALGGRATVDGAPVPLLVADGMFNALPVRAGSRQIVLTTER